MTYRTITHEQYGKVLFNTETQGFIVLPDTSNKIALSGRAFDYFESMREFIESEKPMAIVLFFCSGRVVKGKRYQVTLITSSESFDFWNIEKVQSGWLRNESAPQDPTAPKTGIEICYPGSAYLVYMVKESDCLNGVRIKSIKKVEEKR